MNKEDNEIKTIKLNDNERRELMTLWKNDRDMVLLSYIKGEPNHPLDMIFTIKLQFNLIMVNFLRDINENNEKAKNTKEGFIKYPKPAKQGWDGPNLGNFQHKLIETVEGHL